MKKLDLLRACGEVFRRWELAAEPETDQPLSAVNQLI